MRGFKKKAAIYHVSPRRRIEIVITFFLEVDLRVLDPKLTLSAGAETGHEEGSRANASKTSGHRAHLTLGRFTCGLVSLRRQTDSGQTTNLPPRIAASRTLGITPG